MSKFKVEKTVRKTIFLGEKLYDKSTSIAAEVGLSYTDHIRHLLVTDIKKREVPADIPKITDQDSNSMGTKKRKELIRIMHEIRRLL